jgi:hypothetical protein
MHIEFYALESVIYICPSLKPVNWPPTALNQAHPPVSDSIPRGDWAAPSPTTMQIGSISTNRADVSRSSCWPCARTKPLWFSYFMILLQLTHSFCDIVSIFYIKLNHFLLDCSDIFWLLQCSVILWFCYTELSHFATVLNHFVILLQLPQSFCDLVSNFLYIELRHFATVVSHFSIATVLSHFAILLY